MVHTVIYNWQTQSRLKPQTSRLGRAWLSCRRMGKAGGWAGAAALWPSSERTPGTCASAGRPPAVAPPKQKRRQSAGLSSRGSCGAAPLQLAGNLKGLSAHQGLMQGYFT